MKMNKFIKMMKCRRCEFAVLLAVGAFAVSANAAYTEPRTNVVDGLRWRIKSIQAPRLASLVTELTIPLLLRL